MFLTDQKSKKRNINLLIDNKKSLFPKSKKETRDIIELGNKIKVLNRLKY